MTDGFAVVLDSLVRAARAVRVMTEMAYQESIRGMDDDVTVGHDDLSARVAEFADRWQQGADALVGDQHDIADRLERCAVDYAETDRAATARYLAAGPGEMGVTVTSALADLARGLPPDALVPGDPAAVSALAAEWSQMSDMFADTGRALGRIEVDWTGDAAARFHAEFGLQPGRFTAAAHAFTDAAEALTRYADTLQSAQVAAAGAAQKFAEGLRLATAAQPLFGGSMAVIGLLTSPAGQPERALAVEILERARAVVQGDGDTAASIVSAATSGAPTAVSTWEHARNFLLSTPWSPSSERLDFAAGAVTGILEMASMIDPGSALMYQLVAKPAINRFEWEHGVHPLSGYHTAGSIAGPLTLSLGVGTAEAVAARSALAARTGLLEAVETKPSNQIPDLLYRAGSRSPKNMTPRAQDLTGLSTFDTMQAAPGRPGAPVQVIQTRLLKELTAIADGPNGHYSVAPRDQGLIPQWAATRDDVVPHPGHKN